MNQISQREFARRTGLSEGAVSAAIKEGLPAAVPTRKGRASKIDEPTAIKWLLERERQRARPKHDDPRNALYEEQRRKVWLENEATERQLVKLGDVQVVLNEVMVAIASELEGLPGRMAGELAGLTDPALVRQALRVQITNIRQAAADRLARLAVIGAPAAEQPTSRSRKKSLRKKTASKGRKKKA
jgi:phage terminase Nu1 subunit (DNA packaging protein)